jgi:hypothetical protein
MNSSRLEQLKQYIEQDLITYLPVGFQNLEYKNSDETAPSLKIVTVEKFNTAQYCVIQHHKPISKCLTSF